MPTNRNTVASVALVVLSALPSCGPSRKGDKAPVGAGSVAPPVATKPTEETPVAKAPPEAPPSAPLSPPPLPKGQQILVMEGSADKLTERLIDKEAALKMGYTLLDLSDSYTPLLFETHRDEKGEEKDNRYRRIFLGLANDQVDGDGQKLDPFEKNYLELFGIPPSLSVLQARFVEDAGDKGQGRSCEADLDLAFMATAKPVRHIEKDRRAKLDGQMRSTLVRLEKRKKELGVADLSELAQREPRLAKDIAEVERHGADQKTLLEVEKRLTCEGLLTKKDRHQPGVYDDALQDAVKRFQQKHMIYEAPYLRPKTLLAMSRRMLDNDHEALLRVIRERAVSAAGVLEDGSAAGKDEKDPPTYKGEGGDTQTLRNLVKEVSEAAISQLGLVSKEASLAFMKRRTKEELLHLHAGVKMPALPEYYAPHMDLRVEIDRGDVWYDVPFDEQGKSRSQSRERFPSYTLLLTYRQQKIPLIRWRTTIGGWRSEQAADGYEYFRYKGSDVGPRVIRHISSGPVWIAPESTPIRTLVKGKRVNGVSSQVVNYDEIGPGYRSAYGLVAGYFVVPGENGKPDWDNGIRAHGSSEYLSIYNSEGYSHGCHRLHNHLAVRLYSFLLRHRTMRVLGDQPMGYSRQFLFKDQVYELRIPSRGYNFLLEPPLPVMVLEGRIRGERKQPYTEFVKKPGVVYPEGPVPSVGKEKESP